MRKYGKFTLSRYCIYYINLSNSCAVNIQINFNILIWNFNLHYYIFLMDAKVCNGRCIISDILFNIFYLYTVLCCTILYLIYCIIYCVRYSKKQLLLTVVSINALAKRTINVTSDANYKNNVKQNYTVCITDISHLEQQ